MKRWTSLFMEFRLIKYAVCLKRRGGLFLSFLLIAACVTSSELVFNSDDQAVFEMHSPEDLKELVEDRDFLEIKRINKDTGNKNLLIGWLKRMDCKNQKDLEFHLQTKLSSIYREEEIILKFSAMNPTKIFIQRPKYQIELAISEAEFALLSENFCALSVSEVDQAELSDKSVVLLDLIAQKLTSGCVNVVPAEAGWQCIFTGETKQSALNRLSNFQKNAIRKFKRMPYIFARKIALSMSLAQIDAKEENGVHGFCNVILNTPSEVMPIIFESEVWRKALCAQDNLQVVSLVQEHGLGIVLAEIEYLMELMEVGTATGSLQFIIDSKEIPQKDLTVVLQPLDDVESRLIEQLKLIIQKKVAANGSGNLSKGCWHPVFSPDQKQWETAVRSGVMLLDESKNCQIHIVNEVDESAATKKQFAALGYTTASELEFNITNGRSKVLRLPFGFYQVSISPAIDSPLNRTAVFQEEIIKKVAQIDWQGKAPRARVQ
ncbi:MAG: hypothetical protein KBD78_05285 [Oligoflexales bacterium]|nr:hypothetical protein [Oligoflexales bacterium]